jgi:hypothetical protein
VAGSLQKPALAIKKSALLYVTIAPGEFVEWRGNRIGFNSELFSQIKNNYTIEKPEGLFDQERICFLNNEWIEMGELPSLDSTLRPLSSSVTTTVRDKSQTVHQSVVPSSSTTDYSEEQKQEAIASMIAALVATRQTTLWGFVQDELGISSVSEIKRITLEIARFIVDDEPELQKKFSLGSEWDVRYSYPGYSKKVAQTHRYTSNVCCCCCEKESKQIHHSRYEGLHDEPGVNLFPTCLNCHKSYCHSQENWVQGDPWNAYNVPEWEAKLQAGFQMLARKV